jgi:hypothetical protein
LSQQRKTGTPSLTDLGPGVAGPGLETCPLPQIDSRLILDPNNEWKLDSRDASTSAVTHGPSHQDLVDCRTRPLTSDSSYYLIHPMSRIMDHRSQAIVSDNLDIVFLKEREKALKLWVMDDIGVQLDLGSAPTRGQTHLIDGGWDSPCILNLEDIFFLEIANPNRTGQAFYLE